MASSESNRGWHVVASEGPPDCGGVGHYTQLFTDELRRHGHQAIVYFPLNGAPGSAIDGYVQIPNLRHAFGVRRLARRLDESPAPRRLLLQYVPHGWGWHGMNLGLCFWILWRAMVRRDHISVMFHEVAMPFVKSPMRHNVQAIVQRVMAMVLLLAASKVYVSTPAFSPILRKWSFWRHVPDWLPVPSNIPKVDDPCGVAELRATLAGPHQRSRLVGHFGTFGGAAGALTREVIVQLLREDPSLVALLLGRGASTFALDLKANGLEKEISRCVVRENLDERAMSLHLQACDVLVQPYPDGITTRRSTAMAALANGVALVTNRGELSESLWSCDCPVASVSGPDVSLLVDATCTVLHDEAWRDAQRAEGKRLYEREWELSRTVQRFLSTCQ